MNLPVLFLCTTQTNPSRILRTYSMILLSEMKKKLCKLDNWDRMLQFRGPHRHYMWGFTTRPRSLQYLKNRCCSKNHFHLFSQNCTKIRIISILTLPVLYSFLWYLSSLYCLRVISVLQLHEPAVPLYKFDYIEQLRRSINIHQNSFSITPLRYLSHLIYLA